MTNESTITRKILDGRWERTVLRTGTIYKLVSMFKCRFCHYPVKVFEDNMDDGIISCESCGCYHKRMNGRWVDVADPFADSLEFTIKIVTHKDGKTTDYRVYICPECKTKHDVKVGSCVRVPYFCRKCNSSMYS